MQIIAENKIVAIFSTISILLIVHQSSLWYEEYRAQEIAKQKALIKEQEQIRQAAEELRKAEEALRKAQQLALKNLENIKSEIVEIIQVIEYNDAIDDGNEDGDLDISLLRGIEAGKKSQWRYDFITKKGMSRETWAGIRDMNLGKFKNGKRVGLSIIRFDSGTNSGKPHININPKGLNSKKNPHVPLLPGMATSAYYAQRALQFVGTAMTVVQVAADSYKMYDAINKDYEEYYNAEKNIEILENSVSKLKIALMRENILGQNATSKYKEFLGDCYEYVELLHRYRTVPENTIKTGGSVVGGWTGGIAGGTAGASIGASVLGTVGLIGGPAGAAVGSFIGAVGGGLVGGVTGGIVGTVGGEWAAKMGLESYAGQKGKIVVDKQKDEL